MRRSLITSLVVAVGITVAGGGVFLASSLGDPARPGSPSENSPPTTRPPFPPGEAPILYGDVEREYLAGKWQLCPDNVVSETTPCIAYDPPPPGTKACTRAQMMGTTPEQQRGEPPQCAVTWSLSLKDLNRGGPSFPDPEAAQP